MLLLLDSDWCCCVSFLTCYKSAEKLWQQKFGNTQKKLLSYLKLNWQQVTWSMGQFVRGTSHWENQAIVEIRIWSTCYRSADICSMYTTRSHPYISRSHHYLFRLQAGFSVSVLSYHQQPLIEKVTETPERKWLKLQPCK